MTAKRKEGKKTTRKASKKSAKKTPKKATEKASKKTARKTTTSGKKAPTQRTKKAAREPVARKGGAPAAVQTPQRLVIPMGVYASNKDAIKKPLKAEGMKWQFLGPGKGRYARDGVSAFVNYTDEGADFTLDGEDTDAVARIVAAWRDVIGEDEVAEAREAAVEQKEAEESQEMRIWRIGKPVRQPGEPAGFYKRRLEAWEAKKPAGHEA